MFVRPNSATGKNKEVKVDPAIRYMLHNNAQQNNGKKIQMVGLSTEASNNNSRSGIHQRANTNNNSN